MNVDLTAELSRRFSDACRAAFANTELPMLDQFLRASQNPQFGDFQFNGAMALSKLVGKNPRDTAAQIMTHLRLDDLASEPTVAGPGFINIALKPAALAAALAAFDTPALGLELASGADALTVVVDLCGVNLAKQMHVGHLRSIIIGDALARVLERLGHRVIRQNHVGDWGLPIAMVTDRLIRMQREGRDIRALTLDEIEKLYKGAQSDCAADETGLKAARRWWSHPKAIAELEAQVSGAQEALAGAKATLLKLQTHDPATYEVWQLIAEATMRECLATCARLGAHVTTEHSAGESSYSEELAGLVAELKARGIAEQSNGAWVIRAEGFTEPCIIEKSAAGGGGYLYATTDLAAIRRRVQKFGAHRVIYCVDSRQGLHFKLVFAAAQRAGFTRRPDALGDGQASLEHAANGTVLGDDGRPLKTRSGENVKLADLLDEAESRAAAAVAAKSPDLPADERASVARAVAVTAIKYADLSTNRASDYAFSFDRMLAFEGNTGPYLLYALVRTRSIFRKVAERFGAIDFERAPLICAAKHEKDLALALLRYPGSVRAVADSLEPHRLCQYLYDLAGAFSAFFTECPVLQAPDEGTRNSRLRLCKLTERVLTDGLSLLGIRAIERM